MHILDVTQLVRIQPIKPNPSSQSLPDATHAHGLSQTDTCTFSWRLLIMMADTPPPPPPPPQGDISQISAVTHGVHI